MSRRRRPAYPPPDPRGRASFFAPNPLHPDLPPTSHLPDLPPHPSLTDPHSPALRDDLLPLHDPDLHDPASDPRARDPKPPDADPSSRATPYISATYADFLAPLRDASFAADWIFAWVFSHQTAPQDVSHINLSLSRGFRTMYMCADRTCPSLQQQRSPLQSCATLLVPCQTRHAVVAGHFTDLASDDPSAQPRTGKYVFFSTTRELVKFSKVRGPPTAAVLSSVCINRISPIGPTGLVQDHVMASFPWRHATGKVPDSCVVHSRTLSFSKMIQSAKDACLTGYGGVGDVTSLGEPHSLRVQENSFHAISEFGFFTTTLVPSRLDIGAQSDGHEILPAMGPWAVPYHALTCRRLQMLFLGVNESEITSLRSSFVTSVGLVRPPLSRQPPASSTIGHSQGQGSTMEGDVHGLQRITEGAAFNQTSVRSMELLSLSTDNSGVTPMTEAEVFRRVRAPRVAVNPPQPPQPPPPRSFQIEATRHDNTNVGVVGDVRGESSSQKVSREIGNVPTFGSSALLLPIQPQMGVVRTQAFPPVMDEALKIGPSSVIDSIEAAVSGDPVSSSGVHVGATSPIAARSGPSTGISPGPAGAKAQESGNQKPDVVTVRQPTFKKTLPAPTKNEIVIRNRISAQRSNEKRRRKIEATRTELAFLRTTYLPQLQHRRGNLLSENETLRQRFMERYQQQEIESFF